MEKQKIKSYQDLTVWQKSRKFVVLLYQITDKFPRHEFFGLTNQMRRASVSIPSNIAEGFRRKSKKEKLQFLRISYGSGSEVETQLIIAKDLKYLNDSDFEILNNLLGEILSMLNKIISQFEA